MHNGHTWVHVCAQLCKGGGIDMGRQVDSFMCTDTCTHSDQGMEPDKEWLGHVKTAT